MLAVLYTTLNKTYLFLDNIFICIFFNENVWISIKISLKFVAYSLIDNKSELNSMDKPWLEPMVVYFTDAYASLGLHELKKLFFFIAVWRSLNNFFSVTLLYIRCKIPD